MAQEFKKPTRVRAFLGGTEVSGSNPFPVYILDAGGGGTPRVDLAEDTTTPGTPQTLISEVVPAATTRNLDSIQVKLGQDASWRLEVAGTLVASGRTGPAHKESYFPFPFPQPMTAGQTYELILTQRSGSPANEDVEAYIFSTDVT